ncbi:outer membrane lipoprotein-sorting protein [Hyphomonas sp.]|uniref:outer membrane lipoprotein-sorting protein n=1 Tax=Hyphomonas sp. TaxID=87 RepID=UPI00391CE8F0
MLKPLALSIALMLSAPIAQAQDAAFSLARAIAERPANEGRVGDMVFELTTSNGAVRNRRALMIHSDTNDLTRIGIFFKAPAAIADTAFLSHEPSGSAGENWLYLPATDRVRRLPSSERGSYFMGTDLTYGDIKDNFRFSLDDWDFSGGAADTATGLLQLSGTVRTPDIGKELGYSRFSALIDPKTLFPVKVLYADTAGAPLKEVEILEQQQVGGAWTAMRFHVRNLQTGHTTKVHFENMRHIPALDDRFLTSTQLARGVPTIR